MKKLFLLMIVLALLTGVGTAFAFDIQFGYLYSNQLGGPDLRITLFPFLTLEAQAGGAMMTFANPTVTVDGTLLTMPDNLQLDAQAAFARARVLLNFWRPPHAVVFLGAGGGVGLLNADFNLEQVFGTATLDLAAGLTSWLYEIQGLLGFDWEIPGVPNVQFSAGVGVAKTWIDNFTGNAVITYTAPAGIESEEHEIVIKPNLAQWNTFGEFGVRIKLGDSRQVKD
jgi:hypothetical protein